MNVQNTWDSLNATELARQSDSFPSWTPANFSASHGDMSNAGVTFSPTMDAAAPTRAIISKLRDFPDRISPMVVKELRQGLRSPIFVWAFLIMHLVLAFTVLVSFGSEDKDDSTAMFWWTVVIPLTFILPLRGFNALTEERRLNTHDTLVLTRLNALRITVGKWAAIAAQILLLASTILPYLVMRYFSGAINIFLELRWLIHFTTLGLLFAAGLVGFSWVKYFFLRGIVTLAMGGALAGICGFVIFDLLARDLSFLFPAFDEAEVWVTLGAYAVIAYLIYYLLDFASAQISPLSENRSTLRRIVSLLLVMLFCGVAFLMQTTSMVAASLLLTGAFGVMVLSGIDAATENPRHFSVICMPFVKRRIFGKLAGRFLYPGWHSGLWFLLLLTAIWMTSLFFLLRQQWLTYSVPFPGDMRLEEPAYISATMFGQVLFGLLLVRFFFRNSKMPLVMFLLVQCALGLFQVLLAMFAESTDSPGLNLLAFPCPLSHLIFVASGSFSRNIGIWLPITTLLMLIYLGVLMLLSKREFRTTREMEQQAIQDLATEKTHG